MAEIVEVFEDFGNNTKKLFKDKRFLLLAGGVGVAALVAGYLKNKDAESEEATAYEAIGYAGYPTVGGASSAGDAVSSYYEEDGGLWEMSETVLNMNEIMEKQQDISQMKANSELYAILSTPEDAATRTALHEENKLIAEKWGFTFDEGYWYEGNSVVYVPNSSQSSVTPAVGSTSKNPGTVDSFVNNNTYTENRTSEVKKTTSSTSSKTSSTSSSADKEILDGVYEREDGSTYVIASDGKPKDVTTYKDGVIHKYDGSTERVATKSTYNAKRDTSRAGQTVSAGGYTYYYNEDGYVSKIVKQN